MANENNSICGEMQYKLNEFPFNWIGKYAVNYNDRSRIMYNPIFLGIKNHNGMLVVFKF